MVMPGKWENKRSGSYGNNICKPGTIVDGRVKPPPVSVIGAPAALV